MDLKLSDIKLAIEQAELAGATVVAVRKIASGTLRSMHFEFPDSDGADITVKVYEINEEGPTRSPELVTLKQEELV